MLIAFLYGDLGKNTGHKRCSCYINLKDDVGVRNFSLYITKAPEFMVSKGDKSPIPPHPHFPSQEAPPSPFSLILGCAPSLLCRDFEGQARTYVWLLAQHDGSGSTCRANWFDTWWAKSECGQAAFNFKLSPSCVVGTCRNHSASPIWSCCSVLRV